MVWAQSLAAEHTLLEAEAKRLVGRFRVRRFDSRATLRVFPAAAHQAGVGQPARIAAAAGEFLMSYT